MIWVSQPAQVTSESAPLPVVNPLCSSFSQAVPTVLGGSLTFFIFNQFPYSSQETTPKLAYHCGFSELLILQVFTNCRRWYHWADFSKSHKHVFFNFFSLICDLRALFIFPQNNGHCKQNLSKNSGKSPFQDIDMKQLYHRVCLPSKFHFLNSILVKSPKPCSKKANAFEILVVPTVKCL